MPRYSRYRKSYRRRRPRTRRKYYKRRPNLRRMIGYEIDRRSEWKKFGEFIDQSGWSVNYYIKNLTNSIVKGDNNEDRDGTSINLKSIYLKMQFYSQDAAGGTNIRLMLVKYNEYFGGALTSNAVLKDASKYLYSPVDPEIKKNHALQVFYDKTILLRAQNTANTNIRIVNIFKKFYGAGLKTTWQVDTDDPDRGQLYLVLWNGKAADHPDFWYHYQMSFKDI